MSITEPLVPLDDEAIRRLLWTVSTFQEPNGLDRDNERRLEQQASWDALARKLLDESKARREKARREYDEGLATLRRYADDPRLKEYITTELKNEDAGKRGEAVRLLGKLQPRDWVVAALTDVARNDLYEARRSTSSIEYSDSDVAEMHMETYFVLREEAERALRLLS